MKPGDRVRVNQSVVVYHHPKHRQQPFDLKGMEGTIQEIITEWKGRPISANLPVKVKFEKKFSAHLREDEVDLIEESEDA